MSELKNCLHCGSKHVMVENSGGVQWFGECTTCGAHGPVSDESEIDAALLWSTRAPQSEWISVVDRLPTLKERVLAFDAGGFGWVSARMTERGWYLEGELDTHCNVTHWQPLPEPPL